MNQLQIKIRQPQNDSITELDFDCVLDNPNIIALSGHSGAGKTTVLRIIAGLQKSSDSVININGECWQDAQQYLPTHLRSVAMVFQQTSLLMHLHVRDAIVFGYKRLPINNRKIHPDEVIQELGLNSLLNRYCYQLSGGEQQRVAIAQALLVSPSLLLMDEPLSALDHKSKQQLLSFIRRISYQHDLIVLYVSHSNDEITQIADYVLFMEKGRLIAHGDIFKMQAQLDTPLAYQNKPEALIETHVIYYDDQYHLVTLKTNNLTLKLSSDSIAIGSTVRVRIMAKYVSLTLKRQGNTSILNIFPVTISEIRDHNESSVLVKLHSDGITFLSQITRLSLENLKLKKGMNVFAQIKSMSLLS